MPLRQLWIADVRSATRGSTPDFAIAAALLVCAIGSRFFGLASWDIVLDEIFTVNEAENRIDSLVNPLYYWLVVLTREFVAGPELAARLPSAVLGTIVVPVFYLTWRKLAGRYAALVGALLILLAEWTLWHSQYARFFQGTFLFGSLAYYWYLRGIVTSDWRKLVLSFAAAVVAAGFHMGAATVIVGCGATSMLLAFWRFERVDAKARRMAQIYFAACVVAGLAALPLVWGVIRDRGMADLSWAQGPLQMMLGIVDDAEIAIVFGALAGWLLMLKSDRLLAACFGISIAAAIAALLVLAPLAAVRTDYIFHVMPLAYLLVGYFAAKAQEALAPAGIARHGLAVLIVATLLPGTASHYLGRMTLHARDAAHYIETNLEDGDRVVAFDAGILFYLDPALATEPYPGNPYTDRNVVAALEHYLCSTQRTWIAFRTRREALQPDLERWLTSHSRLVWRDTAQRFDLHRQGFEIFLVAPDEGCERAVPAAADPAVSRPL